MCMDPVVPTKKLLGSFVNFHLMTELFDSARETSCDSLLVKSGEM